VLLGCATLPILMVPAWQAAAYEEDIHHVESIFAYRYTDETDER
jgi:hypothetical protein